MPKNTPFSGAPGTLLDGKPFGFDFIYRMAHFTASPPKLPAKM